MNHFPCTLLVVLAVTALSCGAASSPGPGEGGAGRCDLDSQCPPAQPICDTALHTCGGCSTTPDSCATGERCLAGACVAGCSAPGDCASGRCLASGDCLNCRADAECAPGRVCGTGTCAAPCTTTCEPGWTCCDGRCVDAARDPSHCNGCNQRCGAVAFCGRGGCVPAVLSNACKAPVATALLDGFDDLAGLAMANALAAACAPPVVSGSAPHPGGGLLNPATGEPLVPGRLLCVAGGAYHQQAIAWLELNNLAPVRDSSSTGIYGYSLRDGRVVTQGPVSTLGPTHDVFVVQLVRAPSGAPALNAAGYLTGGTAAASWYFVNVLLPGLSTRTDSWYVVEWTDANHDGLPDAADTWAPVASGR